MANNQAFHRHRHSIMSSDNIHEHNNGDIERQQRATGFYIVRQGEYFLLIPDSNHHFTKNMRPYIGRRRRR